MDWRWLRWIGTGVIAIVAVGSVASVTSGAGQGSWAPRACGGELESVTATVQSAEPVDAGDLRLETWFRMDPLLDRAGALQGQRLAVGIDGDRSSRFMNLPAESFAAGPFGRAVLVGMDDGSTSRLEVVDVANECSWAVAQEADVIRRATIDPTGTTIYEMRVDRATRADEGIWARPLDGSAPALRVLDPIDVDDRFGRTFTTEFSWELSRSRLAVQSCGEAACRTRVLDPVTGTTRAVAEPDLGVLVGFEGDTLVTYAACPGLPCPIVRTDLTTGDRSILTDAAIVAVLTATPDGPRLVHEVFDGPGIALRAMALDGSATADLGPLPEGLRLNANPGLAEAATRVPSGFALLTPEARLPDGGPDARTQLRRVSDGSTVQFEEVAR